ncbi:Proline--tRNA ligase [Labeo rohita]|uniref:Proline--tRNA ligase n=1 Tax=Labeo rohita TaxID=84645 RepID=A0ABQ8LZ98_LABRO|nr:Proline--tRNA ligase [Labeo rohita]
MGVKYRRLLRKMEVLIGMEWRMIGDTDIALCKSQTSCISPSEDFASGIMQNQGGEGFSDPHFPKLAKSNLVSRPQGDADGCPRQKILLRKDLLSQADGSIWHLSLRRTQELWSL